MSRKNNKKGLALFVVLMVLTVLSIATLVIAEIRQDNNGYDTVYDQGILWGVDYGQYGGLVTIGKLAADVNTNGSAFLKITSATDFIGLRYDYQNYGGYAAPSYPSALCAYHSQNGQTGGKYLITNVIDINISNPGITIYGGTNINKSTTETFDDESSIIDGNGLAMAIYLSQHANQELGISSPTMEDRSSSHAIVRYAYKKFFLKDKYTSKINNQFITGNDALNTNYQDHDVPSGALNALNNVSAASSHTVALKESNGKETASITYVGNDSYIGPVTITYDGNTTGTTFALNSLTVNDGEASLVNRKNDGSYETVQLNQVKSGNTTYYVKVSGKTLTNAKIKMSIASDTTTSYKARILFCRAPVGDSSNQNILIYSAEKEEVNSSDSPELTVKRKTTKVVLQKQDASGNVLKVEGIKFEVKVGNKTKTLTTNADGKTNSIELAAGTYTVKEVSVPGSATYGYKGGIIDGDNETTFTVSDEDITEVTVTKNIKNTPQYGNIRIEKRAEYDQTIGLVGAEFKIKNESGYIKLLDTSGKFVQSATGLITISKTGKAQIVEDKTQYVVQYVQNETEATTFITNSNGNIKIENLEVYSGVGTKYNYTAIETSTGAANDYFDILTNIAPVELTAGSTTYISNDKETNALKEPLKYIDLSGYVWLDQLLSKSNSYDYEYIMPTNDNESTDKRLSGITVRLVDKNGKSLYDEKGNEYKTVTDENGSYIFKKLEIEQLSNYNVVFEYNGLTYTTIPTNLEKDNTSKGAEVYTDRENVNNQYTNITGESVPNANNTVTANTNTAGFNLSTWYADQKKAYKLLNDGKEVTNINLGLRLREQPDLKILNDVQNVILTMNGYQYTYRHAQVLSAEEKAEEMSRQQEVKIEFNVSAKFRYSTTIYASDIQALKDNVYDNDTTKLTAYVTYGITLKNQSTTLESTVKEITDYISKNSINGKDDVSIGNTIDASGNISKTDGFEAKIIGDGENYDEEFTKFKIQLNNGNGVQLAAKEEFTIYIKIKLTDDAIIGLLAQDTGIYNVAAISSYESRYGVIVDEKGNITNMTYEGSKKSENEENTGKIYAGLDEDSIPNNEEVKFQTDSSGNLVLYDKNGKNPPEEGKNGTPEIYTKKFEDDTSSAPTLVLQAGSERAISGTVFEDTNVSPEENVRLGNGTLEDNEKVVKGVKVQLIKIVDGKAEVDTYSDGTTRVEFITDKSGNYKLGGFDEESKKYVGILPKEDAQYVLKFTYEDGTSKIMTIDGERDVSVLEYKSTIISDKIKKIWDSTNTKWYVQDNVKNGSYSVAVDDYTIVENLNKITINNETINNLADTKMEANTPNMTIGIEYTSTDYIDLETFSYEDGEFVTHELHQLVEHLENMNFGIIEKPHASVETTKTVTSIEYTNAKGETLFVGNPTNNDKIQYVKYANVDENNRFVEGEIDTDLIQGSTLKVTYAMSIKNTSEVDYTTQEYYYFGTNNQKAEQAKLNITKVVDYLDSDIVFDKDTTGTVWNVINLDNESEKEEFEELIDEGEGKVNTTGYQILISEEYREIARGDTKTTNSYASVVTETSVDNIDFYNCIEILEYTGGKRILDTTPGNYNPNNPEKLETDSAMIKITINPKTGKDINYTPYIITGIITLIIVATGIVIIKKRLLK